MSPDHYLCANGLQCQGTIHISDSPTTSLLMCTCTFACTSIYTFTSKSFNFVFVCLYIVSHHTVLYKDCSHWGLIVHVLK